MLGGGLMREEEDGMMSLGHHPLQCKHGMDVIRPDPLGMLAAWGRHMWYGDARKKVRVGSR